MTTPAIPKPQSILSKRRIGLASVAAFIGCAACCAVPFLAAAGLSGGAFGTFASVFRPGAELIVGGTAFVLTLSALAVGNRLKRKATVGCGSACQRDGACCERETARSA